MRVILTFVLLSAATGIHHGAGGDKAQPLPWPQFRGPGGSAVADAEKPPLEFGPDKNLRWKVPVPSGLSSPIIAGDNLVLTAFEKGKLYTIAYRRSDGQEAWRKEAPAKKIEKFMKTEGSPAASTPATDGKRIVSYFGSCGLVCYDLAGKELWTFAMPAAVMMGNFGSGVSPILVDGLAVIVRDETKNSRIVAVDAATGKLKWERKRQSPVSYCTPVVWDTPAGKQIAAAGHARMIGYDLESGAEKWSVLGIPPGCCASPVTADGLLYFAGSSPGHDADFKMPSFDDLLKQLDKNKDGILSRDEAEKAFEGFFDAQDLNSDGKLTRDEFDAINRFMSDGANACFALKPGGTGEVSKSHVLWKKTKGLPYVTSALLYRGQYVMVKDGGIITAYDAKSGKEVYMTRTINDAKFYASPVAANGHIYFTALADGAVTVVKAGGVKPEVVARNPKLGERVAATPAIADDTLYIRAASHLYACGKKQ
ncbi:MAG: pyrrolo-quinoline quinone [Planctomycetes bacterium]|nr:pyrrolo-quinoline quinone [Planctomycetota bacterium]